MEKATFHDELERLYERFSRDCVFVHLSDAAKYCKMDPRTLLADKTFPYKKLGRKYQVPIVGLARWIAS